MKNGKCARTDAADRLLLREVHLQPRLLPHFLSFILHRSLIDIRYFHRRSHGGDRRPIQHDRDDNCDASRDCRRFLSLAWLGMLVVALHAGAAPASSPRIERAIAEYTSAMETAGRDQRLQRFARAEQLFRQLVDGDETYLPLRNTSLYVNLGNAALQAERIGSAIVAYRQALLLDPRNTQALQNLAYARSLLPNWIRREESSRLVDTLFFWRSFASRGQVVVFAAAAFLAAAIFFSVGVAKQQSLVRNIALAPLLIWGIFMISLAFDRYDAHQHEVVVVSETILYTADSENSAPRLSKPLPSGAEVLLLQQRDQWSEIRLHDPRTGWVRTSAIRHVTPGKRA